MVTYPSTLYPAQKDTLDYMQVIDGTTRINSALFSKFSSAILAIENELGIKPSGTYSDVRQRLDAMQLGINYLSIYGVSHSTTINTKFDIDWLSIPLIPPDDYLPTSIGKLPMNLLTESGFPDGYGDIYFVSRFYIDSDITWFEISLWDITSVPTKLLSNIYTTPGDYTYSAILPVTITSSDNIYEVRVKQYSSVVSPSNISSIVWNSRILFVSGDLFDGVIRPPELKYITTTFDFNDVLSGGKLIGNIETQGMVISTSLIINSVFDGTTIIAVGDMISPNHLMKIADNIPTIPNTYRANDDVEYTTNTSIYLSFTGAPTTGTGTVIVYYH